MSLSFLVDHCQLIRICALQFSLLCVSHITTLFTPQPFPSVLPLSSRADPAPISSDSVQSFSPMHHPFIAVLQTVEREDASPLFQTLRRKYAVSLGRDQAFQAYMDRIGEIYFGIKAYRGMFDSRLQTACMCICCFFLFASSDTTRTREIPESHQCLLCDLSLLFPFDRLPVGFRVFCHPWQFRTIPLHPAFSSSRLPWGSTVLQDLL